MKALGIPPRVIVFEDEVTPDGVRRVYDVFRQQTGLEPTMLFPGAGGYWWKLVHRDTVSAAFKRTATEDRPNVKFSNSPGKETIPGYLRVYERGDTLVVADRSESIDGDPLFVKLVDQGRVVYAEDFKAQAARRKEYTWGRHTRWEPSPLLTEHMNRFPCDARGGSCCSCGSGSHQRGRDDYIHATQGVRDRTGLQPGWDAARIGFQGRFGQVVGRVAFRPVRVGVEVEKAHRYELSHTQFALDGKRVAIRN